MKLGKCIDFAEVYIMNRKILGIIQLLVAIGSLILAIDKVRNIYRENKNFI